ncbi:MAG: hypothetical protein E7464_02190 [Ruminococcaceae bacterium]|nr:hypothetical protein [Oscillospiraceae bacterium]
MSASRERKKRLELANSGQTDKQAKAAEAKKKKTKNVLVGIIAAVVAVAILAGCVYGLLIQPKLAPRQTAALKVGNHELSSTEFSYYYYDAINNFYQNYGSYLSYVMTDPSLPLDEQVYNEETGETWADYFIATAAQSAKYDYAAYDAAKEAGYTLSAESEKTIDEGLKELKETAKANGFTSLKQYFTQIYGQGSSEKSYREYQRIHMTAAEYAQKVDADRTYTDEQISALDAENPAIFSSVSYRSFYISANNYKNADAEETTEEEDAAALEAAEADAKKLAEDSKGNEANFIEGAYNLASEASKASYEDPNATLYENAPYENVNTTIQEWLFDEAREMGDTTYLSDGSTGYYAVYFIGINDNKYNTMNVRHILISPEVDEDLDGDGTADTNSEAALEAAKAEAEQILADWQAGDATEESFAALADEKSFDTAEGGLYEGVYRGMMVEEFEDWCYDESRQPGDTGIVYSQYGYHVLYFVGEGEEYRESMIVSHLKEDDYTVWSEELIADYEATILDEGIGYLRTDMILGSSDSTTPEITIEN